MHGLFNRLAHPSILVRACGEIVLVVVVVIEPCKINKITKIGHTSDTPPFSLPMHALWTIHARLIRVQWLVMMEASGQGG
jgi:hypothetical protein